MKTVDIRFQIQFHCLVPWNNDSDYLLLNKFSHRENKSEFEIVENARNVMERDEAIRGTN